MLHETVARAKAQRGAVFRFATHHDLACVAGTDSRPRLKPLANVRIGNGRVAGQSFVSVRTDVLVTVRLRGIAYVRDRHRAVLAEPLRLQRSEQLEISRVEMRIGRIEVDAAVRRRSGPCKVSWRVLGPRGENSEPNAPASGSRRIDRRLEEGEVVGALRRLELTPSDPNGVDGRHWEADDGKSWWRR